jgi:hypothetical protein
MDCGANIPSPDLLTPTRINNTIWSFGYNHYYDPKGITCIKDNGRWYTNCKSHYKLCIDKYTVPFKFYIDNNCNNTYIHGCPGSGYENRLVRKKLLKLSIKEVTININNIIG